MEKDVKELAKSNEMKNEIKKMKDLLSKELKKNT